MGLFDYDEQVCINNKYSMPVKGQFNEPMNTDERDKTSDESVTLKNRSA